MLLSSGLMGRQWKLAGVVTGVVVLAVAVGASGAIAVSRALEANEDSQAVVEDAAAELGIQPSALAEALASAFENRVDEAVEDGRLTAEQGARLKERIEAGELPLFGGPGLRGFGQGLGRGLDKGLGRALGHAGKLDAAAAYLDLSEEELRERLRSGQTLAGIAEDEGKAVSGLVDALVESASARIEEAVADGRLTEERAAELEAELEARVTDLVNGELRPVGFGRHWFDGRGGPPPFRVPRA